jgi:hypothetical protein
MLVILELLLVNKSLILMVSKHTRSLSTINLVSSEKSKELLKLEEELTAREVTDHII